jgi:two-component system sensor histidine kinase/response regulator
MAENSEYKILIVDDLPKNIMVLGNNLMSQDYQIAYARNGEEAIRQTLKTDFDLILLDIMMPGIDGYDTCRKILANPKTAKVPIIFITAKNDFDSIVKGFDAGAKDYVTKPFNSKELLARVRTHLELKKNREDLESMNEFLEKKVEERTEELRKANEKIRKLDAAKSSFLGIISHEVRTPLNGIYGSIEMLKDVLDEESADILEIITESADRLLSFSELSTLISELNVDHYEITKDTIQLTKLIHQIKEETIENLSDGHQVDFHFKSSSEEFEIVADEKLISKVIYDVIHNSVKFNQEQVQIQIDIHHQPEQIEINIKDNGVGFSEHVLPSLFEVFQSDSEEYVEGKGLNLAAAKLIINAHNGHIEAYNSEEGGAVVCLKLPQL